MPRGAVRKLWCPDPAVFWASVDRNGPRQPHMVSECWTWVGSCGSHGYGVIRPSTLAARKEFATLMAHRVSWKLTFCSLPPPDRLILHHCDVRACVRPDHLYAGNDQDNSDDKYARKRDNHSRGERQHLSKLTEEAVRIIRIERAKDPPTPTDELARRFRVSDVAVSFAAIGKTWAHVEGTVVAPIKRQKLSDDDVRRLCAARAAGQTLEEVARIFGVTAGTVSRIVSGVRRKHVPRSPLDGFKRVGA